MKTARASGGTLGERERLAVGIAGTPAGTVQLGAGSHGVDQALVEHNVVSNVREESLTDVSPHAGHGQEYQDKAAHRHGYGWSVTLLIGINQAPISHPVEKSLRGEHQVLSGADCRAVSFASRVVLDNGEPTISNIQTSTLVAKLHIWTSDVLNTSDRRPRQ
ncbi:hypothetical protein BaRGS_00037810 [Batillaria attramentaria]|uniref:Uncharacterized protein n=1 Tax=Batillaria attramentaria TaxID=370345 RepID=A0ABD0J817_9CAEN